MECFNIWCYPCSDGYSHLLYKKKVAMDTNNGDSVLNIYLYNNGEAIREFSLNSGSTDTFTGLNGKNSYQIGVSTDDSILIDLTITD